MTQLARDSLASRSHGITNPQQIEVVELGYSFGESPFTGNMQTHILSRCKLSPKQYVRFRQLVAWCLHLSVAKWRQLFHLATILVSICFYC